MKRLILTNFKEFKIDESLVPEINDEYDEVLVKIKACGICSSDYSRIYEKGPYYFPLVLGHEFSGQVVKVSKKSNFNIGDNVAIFPLKPCYKCQECKNKNFALCRNYGYFGSRENGALQEFLKIPSNNLIKINKLPYDIAATIEPAAVAINAISKTDLKTNTKILIIGSGIIGLYLGIFLQALGYSEVFFYVRNKNKDDLINSFNFKTISSDTINNFDVIYECVGSIESITKSIEFANSNGQVILVGNPSDDIVLNRNIYWKILRSELNVKGIWNCNYPSHWQKAIELLSTINVAKLQNLIFKTNNFNELISAIDKKYKKQINYIKVMWINE